MHFHDVEVLNCHLNCPNAVIGPGIQYLKMCWNWNALMHALTSLLSVFTVLKDLLNSICNDYEKIGAWQSYSFTYHFLPVKWSKSWRINLFFFFFSKSSQNGIRDYLVIQICLRITHFYIYDFASLFSSLTSDSGNRQ